MRKLLSSSRDLHNSLFLNNNTITGRVQENGRHPDRNAARPPGNA
jgi:hypothetical protein